MKTTLMFCTMDPNDGFTILREIEAPEAPRVGEAVHLSRYAGGPERIVDKVTRFYPGEAEAAAGEGIQIRVWLSDPGG